MGVTKGDTRSLDNGSHAQPSVPYCRSYRMLFDCSSRHRDSTDETTLHKCVRGVEE